MTSSIKLGLRVWIDSARRMNHTNAWGGTVKQTQERVQRRLEKKGLEVKEEKIRKVTEARKRSDGQVNYGPLINVTVIKKKFLKEVLLRICLSCLILLSFIFSPHFQHPTWWPTRGGSFKPTCCYRLPALAPRSMFWKSAAPCAWLVSHHSLWLVDGQHGGEQAHLQPGPPRWGSHGGLL